jgi:O-antigen/teichoic acid export membrane protein
MKHRQGVTENFRWLAGANLAVKPLWFVFVLLSARILGPDEFGAYMYAISYVSVIAVFLEGGVDIWTVRYLAENSGSFSQFFFHTLFAKVISAALVSVAVLVSLQFLHPDQSIYWLVVSALGFNLFSTVMVHCRFVFRAFEIMKYEAATIIIEKTTVLLVCGLALWMGAHALMFMVSYSAAYAVVCTVTLVMVAITIGLPRWQINFRYLLQNVLKPALPYALMSVFMVVYFRSATLMLHWLTGREDLVGFYNAGYRLVESFLLFPAVLIGPMYPSFARRKQETAYISKLLYEGSRIILLFSVGVAVPIALFSKDFCLLFYGPEYLGAIQAIRILILVVVPLGMTWVYGSLVAASGRQWKANIIILAVTFANIVAHYFVIPRWGLSGAAIVTLITEMAIALGNMWTVRDYLPGQPFGTLYLKAFAIALAVVVLDAASILPEGFVFRLCCVGVIMGVLFLASRFVSLEDVRRIMKPVARET